MLNHKHNLWRAYAINAETKYYVAKGPIRVGVNRALQGLKTMLTPPVKRSEKQQQKNRKAAE